jgi:myo-inositol-1(or 4)-monophosphatase
MRQTNQITTEQLEKIVLEACYKAGKHIRENAYGDLDIRWKKKDDPVTRLDEEAELIIRDYISGYTDATFYGEEYGIKEGTSGITIFTDPIDGTKSFIKKEFFSSTSVAAEKDGELVFGAVYDFMKDIMYYANSEGAYIITSQGKKFEMPLIKMPRFSRPHIEVNDLDEDYGQLKGARFRQQTGSVALSMAQTAAGSNNGLIMTPYKKEGKTDTCDIAAGYYIMKQAGLNITDFRWGQYNHRNPDHGIIVLDHDTKESLEVYEAQD